MCGICGFLEPEPTPRESADLVVAMRDEMVHRGPDGAGFHVGINYALGHRRLSIVDLSAAASQPMSNEDGTIWITFNGEIYNHTSLRDELKALGHEFRSRADTEVLVHGWEEWGPALLSRLNGMFAFCIVDEHRRVAFVARDRLGIKPLYYFKRECVFAFASEIKALLRHPACRRSVNLDVLGEHLLFRHVAGSATPFEEISELEPGTYLLVDDALEVRRHRYWSVRYVHTDSGAGTGDEAGLLAALRESVDKRLMSDVPLGTQLSGGIDSSLITKLANDMTAHPIKTFSVGFDESRYNEFPYSSRVASDLGTDHCPIRVNAEDFERTLDSMVWLMDVPIDHPNSLFLHLLCKRAKQDVTVVLTGEGADEILCGYDRYAYYEHVRRRLQTIPRLARRAVACLPEWFRRGKLRRVGEWERNGPFRMAIANSAFGSARLLALLPPEVDVDLSAREAMMSQFKGASPLDALLRLDQQAYLVSILHRQDRVSMGASVESRVPFLDHTLVEKANAWSLSSKLQNGCGKRVLKRASHGLIPREIIDRPKMGFPVPIEEWFRGNGRLSQRLDLLLDSNGLVGQLLDRPGVSAMIDNHRSGRRNHAEDLWILLSLEMWHRAFFHSHTVPAEDSRRCVVTAERALPLLPSKRP